MIGQELVAAWNAHSVERIVALHSPSFDGIDVGDGRPQEGLSGVRRTAEKYLQAFPDLHLTVESAIVDGSQIALVWSGRGTHTGTLLHIPPSGRILQIRGVCILTLEKEKIHRALHIWDVAGMLRAIGLLPDL